MRVITLHKFSAGTQYTEKDWVQLKVRRYPLKGFCGGGGIIIIIIMCKKPILLRIKRTTKETSLSQRQSSKESMRRIFFGSVEFVFQHTL